VKYVLGLDQGASKTYAAVADLQGNIVGCGKTGGGYHAITGVEHATAQMESAAAAAYTAAGLQDTVLAGLGAGLTGLDFPYEYILMEKALVRAFACKTKAVNDCIIALRSNTNKTNSMVICAGSGLNIGLWAEGGREFIFGYYIDECWQGGSAIGRQTLRMVFEADINMQPPTILTERVLNHFDMADVEVLMDHWFKGKISNDKLKHLALVVDSCAAENDQVAIGIQRYFASGCARYALAGMRNYEMLTKTVQVYLSGSIFKSAASFLRDEIELLIHQENPHAVIIDSQYEPVVGGVIFALEEALGGDIPESILQNVYASAESHGLTRLDSFKSPVGSLTGLSKKP
jgi:N-acetylglucosamine kinase-like BadF-type ATPase